MNLDECVISVSSDIVKMSCALDLMKLIHSESEELAQHAPSDSGITINLEKTNGGYFACIKIISSRLFYADHFLAKSPFVAVEGALAGAREAVQNWLLKRSC